MELEEMSLLPTIQTEPEFYRALIERRYRDAYAFLTHTEITPGSAEPDLPNFNARIIQVHYCPMLSYVGDLDLLRLCESDPALHLDSTNLLWAAAGGHIEIVEWLLYVKKLNLSSAPFCAEFSAAAVESDNLDFLNWVKDEEIPLHPLAWTAVKSVEVAEWLFKQQIPWHPHTTAFCVEHGSVQLLLYYHKQGCPWSPHTITAAIFHKRYKLLKLLVQLECPLDTSIMEDIQSYSDFELISKILGSESIPPAGKKAKSTYRKLSSSSVLELEEFAPIQI